jgi:hypothetical protein
MTYMKYGSLLYPMRPTGDRHNEKFSFHLVHTYFSEIINVSANSKLSICLRKTALIFGHTALDFPNPQSIRGGSGTLRAQKGARIVD